MEVGKEKIKQLRRKFSTKSINKEDQESLRAIIDEKITGNKKITTNSEEFKNKIKTFQKERKRIRDELNKIGLSKSPRRSFVISKSDDKNSDLDDILKNIEELNKSKIEESKANQYFYEYYRNSEILILHLEKLVEDLTYTLEDNNKKVEMIDSILKKNDIIIEKIKNTYALIEQSRIDLEKQRNLTIARTKKELEENQLNIKLEKSYDLFERDDETNDTDSYEEVEILK